MKLKVKVSSQVMTEQGLQLGLTVQPNQEVGGNVSLTAPLGSKQFESYIPGTELTIDIPTPQKG